MTQLDLTQAPSIYRVRSKSHLESKIFLDESGTADITRFDVVRYPIFQKQADQMDAAFWKPLEINMSSDRADFDTKLEKNHRHIFTSNIQTQVTGDSVQGRGLAQCLLPIVSDPMVESCIDTITYFENRIHSKAYTHMIRSIYNNPSEVFDSMRLNPVIMNRVKVCAKYGDELIWFTQRYHQGLTRDIKELKRRLYLYLVSVNALEGTQFYNSFTCTFAFGEQGLMKGSTEQVRLIANDEAFHVAFNSVLLRLLPTDDPDFVDIIANNREEATALYMDVIREEENWIRYLLQYGSMLGLSEEIMINDLRILGAKRMNNIGLKYDGEVPTYQIMKWQNAYMNEGEVQKPPQDADLTGYVKGVTNDIDEDSFEGFEL